MNFLKSVPFAIALTTALSQLFSDSDPNARVSRLENEMKKVRCQTAFENFGAKTAAAFPQIDGYGFFVTADFLYWRLYEFQTDFAFKSKPSTTTYKGNVHSMHFDWEPGFRVGLGYIFDYDGWDVALNFTDYSTKAHRHVEAKNGQSLFALWGYGIPFDQIDAHWHVQFKELDLMLGRNYFVSRFLSVHPTFGLSTAWIRQKRSADFTSLSARYKLHGYNNFWGIGPKLAVDMHFFFGRHFSLYGNVAGSLLWGSFHVKEKESQVYGMTLDAHLMVPTVDYGVGIAFETNFNRNRNHFTVQLGYEGQYWWEQNQFPVFSTFSTPSTYRHQRAADDLGMQGLTLNARLDF